MVATAWRNSSAELTGANAAVRNPLSRRKVFSRIRSFVIRSSSVPCGILTRSAKSTFSNSYVRTSACVASRSMASRSSYGATICSSAAWAAGQAGVGSKITTLKPACLAANVNICPNWPPPIMPIVCPGRILVKVRLTFYRHIVHLLTVILQLLGNVSVRCPENL